MRKTLLCIILSVFFSTVFADNNSRKHHDILDTMIKVNSYFMDKYSDYTVLEDNNRTNTNVLSRSIYYEGLLELYKIYEEDEFYQFAEDWAIYNKWELLEENDSVYNYNQHCGYVYLELYKLSSEPERIKSVKSYYAELLDSTNTEVFTNINSFYVTTPILGKLGSYESDTKYFDKVCDIYNGLKEKYPVKKKFLLLGDPLQTKKEKKKSEKFVTIDNIMTYSALSRIIEELPENDERRILLIKDFERITKGLFHYNKDYILHEFFGKNISTKEDVRSTILMLYALSKSINLDVLKKEDYLDFITNSWDNITKQINPDGSLNFARSSETIINNKKDIFDTEEACAGILLLAGSEIFRIFVD